MEPWQMICLSGFVLLAAVGAVGLIANWTGASFQIVKQEKRLVIYRLGVFRDVVGPGLVVLNRHLDTVEREINVRSEQKVYTVGTYFIHGTPFGYMLSFWRRVELKEAAGNNRVFLAHLAQYSDEEREDQVQEKLHEAFQKCVPIVEKEHKAKLSRNPTFGELLLPILPGIPECDLLFSMVVKELQRTLPTIGVFPDMNQPVVLAIKSVNIGPEVMRGFSLGRSLTLLREQFPDLSEDLLLHAFSAINEIDMRMTRLYLEGNGAAVATVRLDEEGEIKDTKVVPGGASPQPGAQARPRSAPSPLSDDDLTDSDWKVLKPMPRASSGG